MKFKEGDIVEGVITNIHNPLYLIVYFGEKRGMVYITEFPQKAHGSGLNGLAKYIQENYKVGMKIKCKVLEDDGKHAVRLTLKF